MLLEIFIPIGLLVLIVALLASAVFWVRQRLTNQKAVTISVNDAQQIETLSGNTLLATLATVNIHLPGACGGRGTCGQCRVVINQGAGHLLPTEAGHINRRDARAGYRLACMVKIREDLKIQLPPAILEVKQLRCKVRSNRGLSTYLTELALELPAEDPVSFRPGDYVLLHAPTGKVSFASFELDPVYRQTWEELNLFRYTVNIPKPTSRAYSLANTPAEHGLLILVVRIALPPGTAPPETPPGQVSSYIFSLSPGDMVNVSGPFGEFHANTNEREMIIIGGGAGIAPLRSIIFDQLIEKKTLRKISFWYGCRNLQELVYAEEFQELAAKYENFTYKAALSNPDSRTAWNGPVGFVHSVVYEHYLKHHPNPEEAEYYICGPPLMSGAVLTMLEDLGVDRDSVFLDDFGSY